MNIQFNKLHPDAIIPTMAYDAPLGIDLYAVENYTIPGGGSVIVSTGLSVEMPTLEGFRVGGFIWSKSGLSVKHNLEVGAGVIDPDYTGEIKVHLYNHGTDPYTLEKGSKCSQLVLTVCPIITSINSVKGDGGSRGDQGFGSSG